MSKFSCLLIDDEPPAIQLLEMYASKIDYLEVLATFNNAIEAHSFLIDRKVDLIFLDIRMPVLSGLDFLKSIQNPPSVIITTAHREYALEGYDYDVVDFLLKPIPFERFLKAIGRFQDRISTSREENKDHIFVNVNRTNHKVILDELIFVESLKDYVRIHTTKQKLVVKGNIGTFLKQLPSSDFLRIHRSYAVNKQHLESYNQSEVQVGGLKIPIGSSYRDILPKM